MTRKYLILLAIAFAGLWWILLVGRPLFDPDEGRYAEIPREMLATGDWVIPHLNGLAYLEKPPLQYWATAIAYRLFGVHEWSARLWTGLTSLLTIFAVFGFGARVWGLHVGLWAAGILASSTLFVLVGHQLTLDASLTFFLTLALLGFCEAQLNRHREQFTHLCMLICWVSMSAAVLTKGVIGILIPGAVIVLYSAWQRDWVCWKHLHLRTGLPLFLLIVLPWIVLAARANPDFLQFFFVHEHFERFLTKAHGRYQPWWYFLMILAIGALPWLPHALRVLFTGAQRSAAVGAFDVGRVLWLWTVFVLAFFSASNSKLLAYIMPMFPALALLMASQRTMERLREAQFAIALTAVAVVGLLVATHSSDILGHEPSRMAVWLVFRPQLNWIAAMLLCGGVIGSLALREQRIERATMTLAFAWFVGMGLLIKSVGPLAPLFSAKPLAMLVREGNDRTVPVFSVREYQQTIPFYWARTVTLVDYRGELSFGLDQRPEAAIYTLSAFKQRWIDSSDALAIMPGSVYKSLLQEGLPMHLTARAADSVVVDRRQ